MKRQAKQTALQENYLNWAISELEKCDRQIKKRYRYACGIVKKEIADQLKETRATMFFESPDGQNLDLFYLLLERGWRSVKYSAGYHWAVENNWMQIEYVEGDIYIKEAKPQATA